MLTGQTSFGSACGAWSGRKHDTGSYKEHSLQNGQLESLPSRKMLTPGVKSRSPGLFLSTPGVAAAGARGPNQDRPGRLRSPRRRRV